MAGTKITRELSIFINDREVVNSLGGINREIAKVNAEMRNLNKSSATYDQDLKKLQTNLSGLKEKQKEFKDEIASTNVELGSAQEQFSKIFAGLATGNLKLAKEGFDGIGGSINGVVKSAAAFVASPIGATIAVLSTIAIATKEWINYNESIRENTKLIENLSGKTGQVVADIRNNITGLSKTFGVEFESIAKAVDNLVDTGTVKDELEGLELIKKGLLTAPDKNEFISSLESSSLVAKQVGLDLQQVISLKQEIEETGVDPDAVFGALQKGSQKLAQQSDDLKLKLRDALGAAFADDILEKVKTGEITTVQALEAIGKKSEEVGLNQKQQADLTVSIFGKAGTAAGGLISITNTLTDAQERQSSTLTPLQQATEQLADSNIALAEAQDRALRSDGYEKFKTNAVTFLNNVKQGFFDLIFEMTNYESIRDRIAKDAEGKALDNYAKDAVAAFEDYVNRRKKSMGELFDFEKVKEERLALIRQELSSTTDAETKKRFESELKALEEYTPKKNAIIDKETADEVRSKKDAADKIAKDQESARAKKKAADEKAAQEEYNRFLALAKAKADVAKAELAYYIAFNQSQIEAGKELTPEIIAEETKRLENIRFLRQNELAQDRLDKIESKRKEFEEGKISEETFNLEKQAINLEYLTAEQNLDLEFYKQTDALKKQYAAEQKALLAEQLLLDDELALAEAQTKSDAAVIKQQQDYAAELARYKKLHDDKKITDAEYAKFLKIAKDKQDDLDKVRDLQKVQSALGGLSAISGAITQAFGQSKEMALVQAGINGAQAVTSILAQWPKFDGGFSMYAAITAAGITTLAEIAKINKAKSPKQPKFYYGGHTGNEAHLGYDQFGKVAGYVHEEEWVMPKVMTKNPRYAATLTWLENERQRNVNGYFNGGETSSGTIPSATAPVTNFEDINNTMRAILYRLENPVVPNILFGYPEAQKVKDLNDESQQSKNNGKVSP